MRNVYVAVLALVLAACSTSHGFDRGALRSQGAEQKVVTEEDIAKAFALKPQLPVPFRLAVYFSPRSYGWRWRGEDKDRLLQMGAELKSKKIISDIVIVDDYVIEGEGRKAVRLAAARAGADAVLIVNGVSDTDRYNNPLAATYALLITPLFVPGTVLDGLFIANASLWDVRNQYLYLSSEAEATASETRPAFFIEETHVIQEAKAEAVAALAKRLGGQLSGMAAK